MKIKIIVAAVLLLVVSSQVVHALKPTDGSSQNLEWQQIRKFDLEGKPVDIAHSLDGKFAFVLTQENTIQVYDSLGKIQGTIPVEKGVNSIALDPRGQYLHLSNSDSSTFSTLAIEFIQKINVTNSPTKGKLDAPVAIAVFSDFQ